MLDHDLEVPGHFQPNKPLGAAQEKNEKLEEEVGSKRKVMGGDSTQKASVG